MKRKPVDYPTGKQSPKCPFMDVTLLPAEKIIQTYKRFSLPVAETETTNTKKLEFFYIGTQSRYICKLKDFFEFGYTAVSTESALVTLKRLLKKKEDVTIPDMIVVEAGVGTEKLVELHRFLSAHTLLADVPFIVEATGLPAAALAAFKRHTFIDELLFLNEFTAPELLQKVNFLKKVKHKWMHEPKACAVESSIPAFPNVRSFLKRVLDLVLSTFLLIVLSPVMLLIALAVKLESGGPVLYISKRTGRGYRIFDFYKFRTTVAGEDENSNDTAHANEYKPEQHDARVTRTGMFLRKTSLDELPQLLNVWLGDMSLVGNRPLPLHEAAKLTTDEWAKRFMVPAGMTGLWQIQKRGKDVMSVEERISLDNDCAEKSDLLYDFWIMANTPPAIIKNTNA
jgi:lipopolysaccharide/colanic/teichoic acid biosynthesis glycosyltransferase